MNRKEHWNQVYQTKAPDDMSWFQTHPTLSLKLIAAAGVAKDGGIIDVGGGASVLVDGLLDGGFQNVAVLDISAPALERAKLRLGSRAESVNWFECDVTKFVTQTRFALWHDRAVFHFLTEANDRRMYVETMKRTLTADGQVIIATFAIDGPSQCSGLEVCRYDAPSIGAELGPEFRMTEQTNEAHVTPWNTEQRFSYFRFARKLRVRP